MTTPPPDWVTGVREGTAPVGSVPATHEVAPPSAITQPGVPSPLGDDASGSVAGAVAAAEARYHGHEVLTHPQGSELGTLMGLPEVPAAHSKHIGGDDAGYPA
jgi:hypothetical protein